MAIKGGKQKGAGRPKGSVNRATADIKAYAAKYSKRAIEVLVEMMENEQTAPATRRAAAAEILDRAHGRPAQAITNDDGSKLFPSSIKVEIVSPKN